MQSEIERDREIAKSPQSRPRAYFFLRFAPYHHSNRPFFFLLSLHTYDRVGDHSSTLAGCLLVALWLCIKKPQTPPPFRLCEMENFSPQPSFDRVLLKFLACMALGSGCHLVIWSISGPARCYFLGYFAVAGGVKSPFGLSQKDTITTHQLFASATRTCTDPSGTESSPLGSSSTG